MNILIKNGRILDPATNTDQASDVFVSNGKISEWGQKLNVPEDTKILDASGCYVMPGLIDMHVHLRDPGLTYKETLSTGSRAAARGGFTTIVAMANTSPVVDNPGLLKEIQQRALSESPIQILQASSLTVNMEGRDVAPLEALKKAGCHALSEDGKTVMDAAVFYKAMLEAKKLNLPVLDHCEDIHMKGNGVMNHGDRSRALGLSGITHAAEDVIIARDLLIAKETGASLHLCHCSTADSVFMLREAKKQGIHATGEVCPHHFSLCDSDIPGNDANYKMAPPLRTRQDVLTLIQGLTDNTIDVISSDHAPHAEEEKNCGFEKAAFGIVGLETSVPLVITYLVKPGHLTPLQMAEKMSCNPARILRLNKGTLAPGTDADITIIDPDSEFTVDKHSFVSKGRNTPYHGYHLHGRIKATISGGRIVYPF